MESLSSGTEKLLATFIFGSPSGKIYKFSGTWGHMLDLATLFVGLVILKGLTPSCPWDKAYSESW